MMDPGLFALSPSQDREGGYTFPKDPDSSTDKVHPHIHSPQLPQLRRFLLV